MAWDAGGPDAADVYEDLARQGLNTLRCAPFHWARPEEGHRMLRVALSRDGADVSAAARLIAETAKRWDLPNRQTADEQRRPMIRPEKKALCSSSP